jgi:hypothetical protein
MDLSVGCIDERGYINGFTRRGYTYAKSILELIANGDDAMKGVVASGDFQPKLLFDVQRTYTKLIDNASGMNSKNVVLYCDATLPRAGRNHKYQQGRHKYPIQETQSLCVCRVK